MTVAVTRAEAHLLTLARVAVGVVPAVDAMRLLVTSVNPPGKLGPSARGLLADTLGRGTVLALARHGGWIREGELRLWERASAPALDFTGNTVRLLTWLLSTPLTDPMLRPLIFERALTPAEDALIAMLIHQLQGTGCETALTRQLALRVLPLTSLTHAAAMASEVGFDGVPAFDVATLGPWLEGSRVLLARAWAAAEQHRHGVGAVDALIRMGRAQGDVLTAYLAALDRAGRRELATWLVDAGVAWLTPGRTAEDFTRGMATDAPLRERTEARRRSAALLRGLLTLREWDQEHRAVRFIDDGYATAQRLVADWGRLGDRGFSLAAQLVSDLDAMPTLPAKS